jgi:hypothetical protein
LSSDASETGGPSAPAGDQGNDYGLTEFLKSGKAVLFLGAGVNYSADPWWNREEVRPHRFPIGKELSKHIADKCVFPLSVDFERENLINVSSYAECFWGRDRLNELLTGLFRSQVAAPQATDLVRRLHETIDRNTPLVVITTNYDDLVERALWEEQKSIIESVPKGSSADFRPFDVVVHASAEGSEANCVWVWSSDTGQTVPVAPSTFEYPFAGRTLIYKLHGSVVGDWRKEGLAQVQLAPSVTPLQLTPLDSTCPQAQEDQVAPFEFSDSFVITETDYVNLLANIKTSSGLVPKLKGHLETRSLLFLGYALRDWNVRHLIRQIYTEVHGPIASMIPAKSLAAIRQKARVRHWIIQHEKSNYDDVILSDMNVSSVVANLAEFINAVIIRLR